MEISKVYFYFFNKKKVGYMFRSYIIWSIHVSIPKPSRLMLLKEIVTVCSDIHTKPISILVLSGQDVVLLSNQVVDIVTAVLKRVKILFLWPVPPKSCNQPLEFFFKWQCCFLYNYI
jgi:hypothetical protein